jgi:hypothetical protein
MSITVTTELLGRLQPLMSLRSEGPARVVARCSTHVVTRATDPFSAADWSGQVVYLVRGQLLASLPDGATTRAGRRP